MSDVLKNLLDLQTKAIPTIPDQAPLVCLVLYLFYESNSEENRVKVVNDLFYHYRDAEYMQMLNETLKSDEKTYECYEKAIKATESGVIEIFDKDFDTDIWGHGTQGISKVYTVSFLVWAEEQGVIIPEYVMSDNQDKIQYYYQEKFSREQTKRNFPKVEVEEIKKRLYEPLWSMTDALLYALGYKSKLSKEKKVGFLRYKENVKNIMGYVEDAKKTGDLKLFEYDEHLIDADQTDIDKKREEAFFSCKVKPREFIQWLTDMPLTLPTANELASDLTIFNNNSKEKRIEVTKTMSKTDQEYEYDVALSFAGEDREYVEEVAGQLKASEVKVFYDKFEEVGLWGKDLYVHLDEVYRKKARYCVMFLSKHYAEKLWTNHERESAQARAFEDSESYVLPARFDDTEIPGIRPTTGYLPIANMEPKELAARIIDKLNVSDAQNPELKNKQPVTDFRETPSTKLKCFYFEEEEALGQVGDPDLDDNTDCAYTEEKAFYLRLIPSQKQEKPLPVTSLFEAVGSGKLFPFQSGAHFFYSRNKYGSIAFDIRNDGENTLKNSAQAFRNGEIWAINVTHIINHEGKVVVRTKLLEDIYIKSLPNYINFARSMGVEPPYTVEAGAIGLNQAYLGIPKDYDDGLRGPIHENELIFRRVIEEASEAEIQQFLLDFFEELFDLSGYRRPENFNNFPK
ncbi:MAG: toll/interleukin-1 receptor domain-containing protein [Alphaproteobacteria bacterium]